VTALGSDDKIEIDELPAWEDPPGSAYVIDVDADQLRRADA
jgi:hypothetical protein